MLQRPPDQDLSPCFINLFRNRLQHRIILSRTLSQRAISFQCYAIFAAKGDDLLLLSRQEGGGKGEMTVSTGLLRRYQSFDVPGTKDVAIRDVENHLMSQDANQTAGGFARRR
jgi:hypothetical protein